MELEGAKHCFQNITGKGLTIASFICDRHRGKAKWLRISEPSTQHYHDFWHVCKSITKKIIQAGNEKGNEVLLSWLKGIRRHLYWCALSTKQGFGDMIVAKWTSIMRHVSNQHTTLLPRKKTPFG